MAFSFYSSLKSIPREMREAAQIYRLQRVAAIHATGTAVRRDRPGVELHGVGRRRLVLPDGLRDVRARRRDFRLPGLGSYLQTAASAGDTRAILWGIAVDDRHDRAMDQIVWRPVIAWATSSSSSRWRARRSPTLADPRSAAQRSNAASAGCIADDLCTLRERIYQQLAARRRPRTCAQPDAASRRASVRHRQRCIVAVLLVAVMLAACPCRAALRHACGGVSSSYSRARAPHFCASMPRCSSPRYGRFPSASPSAFIPRLARIAQPLAQIAASVPATALFPSCCSCLRHVGGGLGIGSIVLMLLGTQWYILFNVIAGAMAIPTDLQGGLPTLFQLHALCSAGRTLILPGIFPYLITGLVTASGGAWNASIVAEYFHLQGPDALDDRPRRADQRAPPTTASSPSC